MSKDTFMPDGYEVPKSSGGYMKFEDGENKILALSGIVTGYEYWNKDNKPVRSRTPWKTDPTDIKLDQNKKPTKVKHFWAFPVWNYNTKSVQLLQVSQKSIMESMASYVRNEDWGNPVLKYSFTINKTGSGLKTEYTVMANPKKDVPKEITDAWEETKDSINLEALFESKEDDDDIDWPEEKK